MLRSIGKQSGQSMESLPEITVVTISPPIGCEVLPSACLYVCLSVCPLSYFKNYVYKLHLIFWTCHVCPWLGRAMQQRTVRYEQLYSSPSECREQNRQKICNKHQNTVDMLDHSSHSYRLCVAYKINCK